MATVYVVTSGDYSDYRIRAIYSDNAVADKFCEEQNKCQHYSHFSVEPWDVDAKPVPIAKKTWSYTLYLNSGIVCDLREGMNLCKDNETTRIMSGGVSREKDCLLVYKNVCVMSFESQDHAYKVATEIYQNFLRVIASYNMKMKPYKADHRFLLTNPNRVKPKVFETMVFGHLWKYDRD